MLGKSVPDLISLVSSVVKSLIKILGTFIRQMILAYCAHSERLSNRMFCNPVTMAELITEIAKLIYNKAAGPDK